MLNLINVAKLVKWIKGFWLSTIITISFALKRVDDELRANPLDLFRVEQRAEIRDMFSMFDEAYVQRFYEILKKADKFLRSANPSKIQKTAGKFGMNYGIKDHHGRRFEHYGFFDEKHRFSGKSIMEVRDLEIAEKKIDDDNYPVIVMYQNKKDFSFSESAAIILDNDKGFYAPEIHELARMKKYPLLVFRGDKKVANRIEQLTEFLHVKQVDTTHKILEFMIPKKFKLEDISEDDPIFKELVDIQQVWFKDEYGDRNAYRVTGFYKRGVYKKHVMVMKNGEKVEELNPNAFDIIKFRAEDIIKLD